MHNSGSLPVFTRRDMLSRLGAGFGTLGLTSLLADEQMAATAPKTAGPMLPKQPHFPARAKHVIFLFMNGAPSHVDTLGHEKLVSTVSAPLSTAHFAQRA